MKRRIQAVQRTFWLLCVLGVGAVGLAMPAGKDGVVMGVLRELEDFRGRFDRGKLEASLLAHARAQGSVALGAIAGALRGEGLPVLSAARGEVAPRAGVQLDTLGRVQALSQHGASIEIATPEPAGLALAIGWRLARRAGGQAYEIAAVEVTSASASAQDVALEREVEEARRAEAEAARAHAGAIEEHTRALELVEMRRKWKAPWKSQLKAKERQQETEQAMQARASELDAARARHASLAEKALGFKGGADDAGAAQAAARVELHTQPGGERVELIVPVALQRRGVPVPALTGANLPVARASALWDELAAHSLDEAIADLGQRFSWHYAHVADVGLKLGGSTVLQLAPLSLLAILSALLRRSRVVRRSYNPFDVPAGETLPIVGIGLPWLNALPLFVLPVGASVLSVWSLVQLDTLAVLPALAAVGAVILGSMCYASLRELANLRNEVARAHSHLPPAAREA